MIIKNNVQSGTLRKISIKGLDFQNDGILLIYYNSNFNKLIKYVDIKSTKIIINTPNHYTKPNVYHLEYGYKIVIIVNDSEEYIINTSWTNLEELYCILYYSKQIKDFSIAYTGKHVDTKIFVSKRIQEYVDNNYKKNLLIKFYSFVYTPITPFKIFIYITIFLLIFCFIFEKLL